jgi:hypothetical protein
MRARDTWPSCNEKVAASDFLCPNCELIVDPSQIPEKRNGEVSVVRRMLEPPQQKVPAARPVRQKPPPPQSDGPTRVFAMPSARDLRRAVRRPIGFTCAANSDIAQRASRRRWKRRLGEAP